MRPKGSGNDCSQSTALSIRALPQAISSCHRIRVQARQLPCPSATTLAVSGASRAQALWAVGARFNTQRSAWAVTIDRCLQPADLRPCTWRWRQQPKSVMLGRAHEARAVPCERRLVNGETLKVALIVPPAVSGVASLFWKRQRDVSAACAAETQAYAGVHRAGPFVDGLYATQVL